MNKITLLKYISKLLPFSKRPDCKRACSYLFVLIESFRYMKANPSKFLLTFNLIFFLSACSSKDKPVTSAKKGPVVHEEVKISEDKDPEVNGPEPLLATDPSSNKSAVVTNTDIYEKLNLAIKNQRDDEIYKQASSLLMQFPQDLKALNALGIYHYKKGRFEAAKYMLTKALQAHPQSYEVLGNLGVVYLAIGEKREAIRNFRKALEINSRDGMSAANLGSIYTHDKNYAKAQAALSIAVESGLKDFRINNNYAISLAANGEYSKSEEIYEQLVRDNGLNKEVLLNYSILLVDHLKKYTKGSEIINRLKLLGVNAEMKSRLVTLENEIKNSANEKTDAK